MTGNPLITLIYPDRTPKERVHLEGPSLLQIAVKLDELRQRLALVLPPKEDLGALSRQSSPMRFERADLAALFLAEAPEFGEAALWRDAATQDAALGELWVHLDPLSDLIERELAVTLAQISVRTGRIERTLDRLNKDPRNHKDTGPFGVIDRERQRLDRQAAAPRPRPSQRPEGEDAAATGGKRQSGAAPQKVPGRRGGARGLPSAAPARLTAQLADIHEVRDAVLALYEELGLEDVAPGQEEELTVEIDPRAHNLIVLYISALRLSERVAREAQVDADELAALHRRGRALGGVLGVMLRFLAELSGARLIIAAAQGRAWAELVQRILEELSNEGLPQAQRVALKNQSREILAQAESEAQQQQQRSEELRSARAAAQAKVEAAQARRSLVQALINLQEQQEIDPQLVDELLRVYHQQVQVPGEKERPAGGKRARLTKGGGAYTKGGGG